MLNFSSRTDDFLLNDHFCFNSPVLSYIYEHDFEYVILKHHQNANGSLPPKKYDW